jgi:hypothetical protein
MTPGGTAEIVIPTGRLGLTVMVTAFEVAGFPDTQVAFDVITQVTTSLFTSVEEI